jgi:hypothetical protein
VVRVHVDDRRRELRHGPVLGLERETYARRVRVRGAEVRVDRERQPVEVELGLELADLLRRCGKAQSRVPQKLENR